MEDRDIILHFAQDADDFVNDKVILRMSYEKEEDGYSNIYSIVKKIDSESLDNISEMETIIESMKIDLLRLSTKKRPDN